MSSHPCRLLISWPKCSRPQACSEIYKFMTNGVLTASWWTRSLPGASGHRRQLLGINASTAPPSPRHLPSESESTMLPAYSVVGPATGHGSQRDKRRAQVHRVAWWAARAQHPVPLRWRLGAWEVKHSKEQPKQITIGLERSGQWFLWGPGARPCPRWPKTQRCRSNNGCCSNPELDVLLPSPRDSWRGQKVAASSSSCAVGVTGGRPPLYRDENERNGQENLSTVSVSTFYYGKWAGSKKSGTRTEMGYTCMRKRTGARI